jgi:two-component sensor histidine kinase
MAERRPSSLSLCRGGLRWAQAGQYSYVDTDHGPGGSMAQLEFELPASADASRLARERLHEHLPVTSGEAERENALLLTTELVTNAVRHGALSAGDRIVMVVEDSDHAIRISIVQPTPASGLSIARDARAPSPDRAVPGGLGLVIVDELAERWGVDVGPPGRVWFELGLPR